MTPFFIGHGRAAESRLIRPSLIERRYLNALINSVEALALGDIPADREHLASLVQARDRPIGMFGADVDILNELYVRIGREECPVGVIGLTGIVADVKSIRLRCDELRGWGIALAIVSWNPFIRPCAQNCVGSPPDTANTFRSLLLAFIQSEHDLARGLAVGACGIWVKLVNSWPREVKFVGENWDALIH